jgi:hypothetical protein
MYDVLYTSPSSAPPLLLLPVMPNKPASVVAVPTAADVSSGAWCRKEKIVLRFIWSAYVKVTYLSSYAFMLLTVQLVRHARVVCVAICVVTMQSTAPH